jgi:adenosylcobinamide-phosphate synthase
VAGTLTDVVAAHPIALVAAVLLDLAVGDPVYRAHPIRLMGSTLAALERALRRAGADGYIGGVALGMFLAIIWIPLTSVVVLGVARVHPWLGWAVHVFILYSLIALGDLLRHVWRVERALSADNLDGARVAIANLVGRDTAPMDAAACRRAAIESLSENLTDGVTSPIFWYALLGLPGIVLFKIASTMDSMVGYKNARYLRFGWCGARLDDAMNYVPARLTWLLIAVVACVWPRCSGLKAWRIGLEQHRVLLGPNSGWSEAATAGAIQRRLVGPIWLNGVMVTDTWIGEAADPPAGDRADVVRAIAVATSTAMVMTALAVGALMFVG